MTKFQSEHARPANPRLAGKTGSMICLLTLGLLLARYSMADGAVWLRPGSITNQAVRGLRGGLIRAVAPGGFRGGEPGSLIRLGCPVLADKRYDLINFIAVEEITN